MKAFLVSAMLLVGGIAQAQVTINGNVFGGGNVGEVTGNASVTVNGGTVGKKIPLADRVVDKNVQIHRVEYGNVYGGGNGNAITGHNPNNNAPIYDLNAGRVRGNTTVYIGGDAVVRRAVYGGGNMASVGVYTANNGVATYTLGGETSVTVEGNALIGPKKEDLTTATADEFAAFFGEGVSYDLSRYVDSAFKYLGGNEGWVFGSSRGISGGALRDYSFAKSTEVTIGGNAQVLNVFGSGENGHVQTSTNVTVKGNALIGGVPLHDGGTATYTVPSSGIATNEGEYKDATYKLAVKDSETAEDQYGVGREIVRGNVFGGGKGSDFISWFEYDKYCYTSGRVYGNTYVTVQDNALIYNRVYGGGVISMVGTFIEEESSDSDNHTIVGIKDDTGHTYVDIKGGAIGSPGSDGGNCGEVYGGSRGLPGRPRKPQSEGPAELEPIKPLHQVVDEAYVGHTHVTVSGGTIMSNVYGGAANGHVQGDAHVEITGGTIGTTTSHRWHGNVYGGGGGTAQYTDTKTVSGQTTTFTKHSITSGRVFGDTYVDISGGMVYHNVYGGGAIASVGTYDHTSLTKPYLGNGKSYVTITGGTIGTNGVENGMVFGSGRGEIAPPGAFMDSLTYMAYSTVNIGQATTTTITTGEGDDEVTTTTTTYSGDAKINGSVYGSGENGHVYLKSQVNIYGGTIGCTADEFEAFTDEDASTYDATFLTQKFPFRGNVYGAGCGTDKYTVQIGTDPDTGDPITEQRYNPNSGFVQGNTVVNVYGGYISRNVYGGGAMASVGFIDHFQTETHAYEDYHTKASLSWPYKLVFVESLPDENSQPVPSGIAKVNIFGGHIGTVAAPVAASGDVYGSSRGEAGPLGHLDTLAIVRNTVVNVNFPCSSTLFDDDTPDVIVGSVYGSGENGSVYDDTQVTLTNGLVVGSVFGGGSGTGTYRAQLKDTEDDHLYWTNVRSITAGKVYGSTEVEINGGYVLHNVYGGGNLASVGKGNYMGYGELSESADSNPYEGSGTTTVTINGGTIGTDGLPDASTGAVNGFVYGSSKGTTFVNVSQTPRYDYSRDFFLGYSNKTEVVIGDPDPEVTTGPTINGTVLGGGENGHVRWHTDVTVNKGTIGVAYSVPEHYPEPDSINMWVYRGNVYGAGRGIEKIDGGFCNSAGSVTLNTTVTIKGGTIYRNVYGGGSNASVGPPTIPGSTYSPGTSLCTVNIEGGTIGQKNNSGELIYGGNVYGASRGHRDLLTTTDIGRVATCSNTDVNIKTSGDVYGNVYGGGEIGQVKINANVDITTGDVEGSVYGGGMGVENDEKAALVAGNATVNMTGGTVERSIYGGGELASVGTFLTYDRVVYEYGNDDPTDNDTVYVPKTCKELTGLAQVVVSGGSVGLNGSLMPWENHNIDDDDRGWIFCGCQGLADSIQYPKAIALGVCGTTYLEIKNTTTELTTITPLVTASVYGGSENGLVLSDTHVKIDGGQIGSGHYIEGGVHHWDEPYLESAWNTVINKIKAGTFTDDDAAGFHECDAWSYVTPYKVYDIYANKPEHPNMDEDDPDYNTSALVGTNGHSFFGNVFGGGSGYYPIAVGVWRRTAGQVNGNTLVEITGGHILTAVYGGNEYTDVLGKCTIEMSDGTVGVPRTKAQIAANPTYGYIFGAGMGDPRNLFKEMTNVNETEVSITGGTIFGSVYGASKEGHVLADAKVSIGQDEGKTTIIGTTGLSGHDGLVFGGGKGKDLAEGISAERKFPVGRVGGNTQVTMSDGSVLGCIYGGGQVGLVGVEEDGWIDPDETYDAVHHGFAKVDISGGIIGGSIRNSTNRGRSVLLSDQKVGNVYGGGRGNLNEFREDDLGRVAKSVVNISGNPFIYGSVFGGGQMANVGYWVSYEVGYALGTSKTQVNIEDSPTIGTAYEFEKEYADNTVNPPRWTKYDIIKGMKMITHTLTGNVYGGGQGNLKLDNNGYVVGLEHGHCGETEVNISDTPAILSCVFGGSEEGAVWGDTKVTISGGTIGKTGIQYDSLKYVNNAWVPADHDPDIDWTYSFGSVFGGSYGANSYEYTANPSAQVKDSINGLAGRVYGNATVSITGGDIRGNVFGGGDMASVGEYENVLEDPDDEDSDIIDIAPVANTGEITLSVGGTALIGPIDHTGLNAYVYGGGKGFPSDPNGLYKAYANVNSTIVTIDGGFIEGSVYGGGSDSHVLGDVSVTVEEDAYIGTVGYTTWGGNVFGGGRNLLNTNHSNGRVAGNIDITMTDGTVLGTVYGGGRLALSGVNMDGEFPTTGWTVADHGNVTIKVSGGEIGDDYDNGAFLLSDDESIGDIFGSGKGDITDYMDIWAGRVTNATITIKGSPRIYGSVFGGGEMASLGWWDGDNIISGTGAAVITIGEENRDDNPKIGTELEQDPDYLDGSITINEHPYQIGNWTIVETVGGVERLVHTCTGNVFGGCQGDIDFEDWDVNNDNTWNNWPYMGRSYSSTITVNSGTILGTVYGGPEQGTMDGGATITINGGTIGSVVTDANDEDYNFGGVYGAGYGSDDPTDNTTPIYANGPTADLVAGRVYGDVLVDVLGGTIKGNVFGGASFAYVGKEVNNGKGNALVNIGTFEDGISPTTDLDTTIYIGDATILGNVYGANNRSGTPYGDVTVNVYKTHHDPATNGVLGNWYPAAPHGTTPTTPEALVDMPHETDNFAIYQVFGGSNQTDYLPRAGEEATVHVYACQENTIYQVFGGSNAANIGSSTRSINANVIIDGGRMHQVFGGGNGIDADHPANIYGTATTNIDGGLIDELFGGSNNYGNINGINLIVSEDPTCDLVIGNGYGGGNEAPYVGNIVAEIMCGEADYDNFYGGASHSVIYGNVTLNVYGGTITNLFGGSKGRAPGTIDDDDPGRAANIRKYPSVTDIIAHHNDGTYPPALIALYDNNTATYAANYAGTGGNVTVNLYGGTISNVFGGIDSYGNVEGIITVNVLDIEGACPLKVANIYGASNQAIYTPNDIIVEEVSQKPVSPVINVVHIKDVDGISQNVYGGGKGYTARVTSNPLVNIGYNHATMAQYIPLAANGDSIYHVQGRTPRAFVNGAVYGGGEHGPVLGNTTVNVTRSNTVIDRVYGAGCGTQTDLDYGMLTGNTKVRINNGLVKRSVFGGGEMAIVTGNTDVEVSGGTIGSWAFGLLRGSVYGGGQGATSTFDPITEEYIVVDPDFGRVMGNTYVNISGNAQILKDVFGGGQIGSVGSGNLSDNTKGVTHVTISGGQIGPFVADEGNANVFGGSQGSVNSTDFSLYTNHANVDSTSVIVSDNARINGSVFGGSENGHVLGGTNVLVEHGANENGWKPVIGTDGLSGWDGNIFGGGAGTIGSLTAGRVGGNTKVVMSDGTALGNVYGGGQLALTGVDMNGDPFLKPNSSTEFDSINYHGLAIVEVTGGVIGTNAGTTDHADWAGYALLDSDYSVGDIFGGGSGDIENMENVLAGRVANARVTVSGSATTIYSSVFGGGEMAGVGYWHNVEGKQVFYGNSGTTSVAISGSPTIGTALEFTHDYAQDPTDWTVYDTINNVRKLFHTCTGNVFGASQGDASVDNHAWVSMGRSRKAYVTISGTPTIMASVFGGAEQGTVSEDTHVHISGGIIGQQNLPSDSVYWDNTAEEWVHYVNDDDPFEGTYSFGSVFGGGYGVDSLQAHVNDSSNRVANYIAGRVYGNTCVTITGGTIRDNVYGGGNMASVGWVKNDGTLVNGKCTVNLSGKTIVGPLDYTGMNAYVYGGGKGIGKDPRNLRKAYCNVNETEVNINLTFKATETLTNWNPTLWNSETDGRVYGSLFGGGADAHTLGNTKVNLQGGLIGTDGTTSWDGNIFGGGRNFLLNNYTAGRVGGNVTVVMTGGQLLGSLYGGGRNAITGFGEDLIIDSEGHVQALLDGNDHGKVTVQVKGGIVGNNTSTNNPTEPLETVIDTFTASSMGSVYGGGKGNENGVVNHPAASALLVSLAKNTVVEISQEDPDVPTHIYGIVFGGGEVANVGQYTWTQTGNTVSNIQISEGLAKVTISGGIIGGDRARMRHTLESYDDDDNFWPKYNDDLGYVYGGGEGTVNDPDGYPLIQEGTTEASKTPLINLMATVNNTDVRIYGGLVKASVFGGAESGHVRGNAKVTIKGGQIGVGYDKRTDTEYAAYNDSQFVNPLDGITDADTLCGTVHWPFGKVVGGNTVYNPFDLVYLKQGIVPSDGKSWFGNVFGGGSGWFPYVKKNESDEYQCYWNPLSGRVWGNTEVIIADSIRDGAIVSRPHILNNVYGGNEATDIGGTATITMSGGTIGVPRTSERINKLPTFGYLFGGGCGDPRAESKGINNVEGNVVVNITGGIIYGSVYGGAEDGHVIGSTSVSIGQTDVAATPTNPTVIGSAGTSNDDGNVFGGGRNYLLKNYTSGRVGGNDTVVMTGGHVLASIYGGGRNAATGLDEDLIVVSTGESGKTIKALQEDTNDAKHGHTVVRVKGGKVGNPSVIERWTANSIGDVYGGGKGSMVGPANHPVESPLLISLVKSTEVEIAEVDATNHPTFIYGNVFGGGEVANVGNFTWLQNGLTISQIDMLANTGKAKVDVSGGRIGIDRMVMSYELIGGDGPDKYYPATVSCGNVFGGGEGLSVDPTTYGTNNINTARYGNKYLIDLMATVGSTEITVGTETGKPWVKGSVYGGAAMGHVFGDTKVTIANGQIGAANNGTADQATPYEDGQFINPANVAVTEDNVLKGTYHWDYGQVIGGNTVYNTFDLVDIYNGIDWAAGGVYPRDYSYKPSDGKTWFGNVYGGGSGFLPYVKNGECIWNHEAGMVYGNSTVEITGGHILTSVYGGCETADVGVFQYNETIHGEELDPNFTNTGTATVTIKGGTVGVPRTLAQIEAHPVICYVFGSGKGDPRLYFNTWTNVQKTVVNISNDDANVPTIIYGSVFGGGEEGHVLGDVDLKVSQAAGKITVIGTHGTSTVDGNIFGGGRGFDGTALTAGTVGGNIDVTVSGGTMLGSIYGGGRLASVGTYLVDAQIPDPDHTGQMIANPYYGRIQPFNPANPGAAPDPTIAAQHGHITVNVTGGTVGNSTEIPTHDNPVTIGGNVFGGCKGKFIAKTGTETPIWPSLARAKYTTVIINGDAKIKNSVYGGGEIGTVRDSTTVKIKGGTIGGDYNEQYCGHVFGGGMGFEDDPLNIENDSVKPAAYIAGMVYGNTNVFMSGGHVYENVYGGGQVASVGRYNITWEDDDDLDQGATAVTPVANTGLATVKVTGGQIGPLDGTGRNAYVFGGSKGGMNAAMKPFCNVNNTMVELNMPIDDGTHANRVWGSLFGGGSNGHLLGDAVVTMKNGLLGTDGTTGYDGNIFGGGRNYYATSESAGRVNGNVTVNMMGGQMKGSIFGGGRLGSVGVDLNGEMMEDSGGKTYGYITVNVGGDNQVNNIAIGHAAYNDHDRIGGNVYGGAKGIAGPSSTIYPDLAQVKQTEVNINEKSGMQTWIESSVFGSGEDGHVAQNTYVNIHGGQIGGREYGNLSPCDDPYHGNVYGGGRGIDTYEDPEHPGTYLHSHTAGWVKGNTNVNMFGGHVVRNVYGGGNLASVGIADEPDPEPGQQYSTGLATVTITGGTVGTIHENENFGNVFGSGHGGVGGEYVELAFVKNTHVTIGQTARIYGSVFGGGEDGHVRKNAIVDIEGGIIGDEDDVANQPLNGNVYGGGRGLLTTTESESAGEVYGYTTVNIMNSTVDETEYTPVIWNNVYGGGSQSVVHEYKVVNMSGGLIHGNLFGGSREIPATRPNKAPRWVNMWGGIVEGNVFGCSYFAEDGDPANDEEWASFVNISGGTIGTDAQAKDKGNVYGAGYGGKVKGSVAVLIGKNAIVETSNNEGDELYGKNIHRQAPPTIADLDIKGNVFGGSYGSIGSTAWEHSFNVSGYSRIYIDGTGYNTTASSPVADEHDFMDIKGGVYGCGTNCESGAKGRNILVRNYGTRNPEGSPSAELTQASRTMTTFQRGDMIWLDNVNVKLSGADDISQSDSDRAFAVLQVDKGVYVTNASGLVLGAVGAPAYMDSIHEVRSLHLKGGFGTSYDNMIVNDHWEWIGVDSIAVSGQYNTAENARLYYTQTAPSTPLSLDQENVIIFNGDSRLYVRYLDKTGGTKKRKYGQLQGFFRMRGDKFQPVGTESFAYARPKVTPKNNPISIDGYNFAQDVMNGGDGGFLSYDTRHNFFTRPETVLYYTYTTKGDDGGNNFTKTKQYPYFNIGEYVQNKANGEMDLEEFRQWVLPVISGKIWYVDGRGIGNGGWGKDGYHQLKWGHFPDMPKKTITGECGIYFDDYTGSDPVYEDFNPAEDIIYVVGPIEAINEEEALNQNTTYTLKLYRYPGGHIMSNDEYDETVVDSEHPAPIPSSSYNGLVNEDEESDMASDKGPGANLGMMIHANRANFVMENVLVDGLYGATPTDVTTHNIPTSFMSTQVYKVDKPMVVTTANNTLTLKGRKTLNASDEIVTNGTILQRGYNGTDATNTWYSNADYNCYTETIVEEQPVITVAPQGGGLFVDKDATVNVEGLVNITGSKQRRMVGSEDDAVNCNVYLPTFLKSLSVPHELTAESRIGVTSPIRNTAPLYEDNTFSPVAKADNSEIANAAWVNCNFLDDQNWFFVNQNKTIETPSLRTTYYDGSPGKSLDNTELYFGWTWASVVRTEPTDYSNDDIDSPEDLAWLITKTKLSNDILQQTADLDMGQYLWVPIGADADPFVGNFDGQGHLIKNLNIKYIGTGDKIYERTNYGLFGYVHNGTVDRTFVVSSRYEPYVSNLNGTAGKNIGGLVGYMDGTSVVSNSEAAAMILGPNYNDDVTGNVLGGLVAKMMSGEVHSSMAMSTLYIGQYYKGVLGGLVGDARGGHINNSFANATFSTNNITVFRAGGLIGDNTYASMKNCYVTWIDGNNALTPDNFGRLMASNATSNANNIQYCYAVKNTTKNFGYTLSGPVDEETCKQYLPVYSADMLGYMYEDNKIEGSDPMFVAMNRWVTNANNSIPHKYATWARPGLQEINGDLPVLLLSEFDGTKDHQGGFRSLSTYEGGPALQYGGPVRDTIIGQALNAWSPQLDGALTRATAGNSIFIYGDVVCAPTVAVSATKVSVYEHASILSPGSLVTKAGGSKVEYDDTYVGITFDNSKKNATATYGVNYGLGGGNAYFTRDWHMFSTPLSSAPLGFDYKGDNVEGSSHYNNPWVNQSMEFNWLNNGTGGNIRYWMKGWTDSQGPNTPSSFVEAQWVDGYFPSSLSSQQEFGTGCVEGTDEYGRYPYGMDFYTWTEPDYHWINFKRNGPNHWHSDGDHKRIDYEPVKDADVRVNEENLIVGRGYMASISMQTFLQSHGKLNAGNQSIALTKTGKSKVPGWNLVGNPYHGYIDFDKLALNNGEVLDIRNSQKFYVVYDADGYGHGGNMEAGSAFLYYAVGGSTGGEYADRYIHPHQGFYVLAKDGGGNLQFTESMLVGRDGITSSFRDEERPAYPLVNLYLSSDNGCNDVTVIELERPEWGGAKKIRELRNGNGLFYAQHDNTHYAALFAVVGTERVPLWFEAKEDDIYTIKWNTANGDFHSMYLIDNKLGVQYDMLRNDTYSFEGHVGDYPSRFYIVFNVTDIDEHLEGNGFVFFDDSQWIVTGEGDLEFIDVQGQVLVRKHVGGGQSRITVPDVAPGVYLFRLSNSEGTRVQKVIVKR